MREERGVEGVISFLGWLVQGCIRLWLCVCGRTARKADAPWLDGPVGPNDRIGGELYDVVAARQGLDRDTSGEEVGLVPDWGALAGPTFDPSKLLPEVRDFYQRTSRYRLDAWSEAKFPSSIFLWILVKTVSRRMDQLNFPVSPLEVSRGMTSEIVPLREKGMGRIVYTGWFRTVAATGSVIYAGFYTSEKPPLHGSRCVKVIFPVPRGSATVLLRPEGDSDGSLRLISSGTGFGGPGFYRMLEIDSERWKVRYLKTLREYFHVYVDGEKVVRCDHTVTLLGLTVLKLHYKITPSLAPSAAA